MPLKTTKSKTILGGGTRRKKGAAVTKPSLKKQKPTGKTIISYTSGR